MILDEKLVEAAQNGKIELARALIKDGADINATSASCAPPLFWSLRNKHFELAGLLLNNGANTNFIINPPEGTEPLLYDAMVAGDIKSVKLLLEIGVDPNSKYYGVPYVAIARSKGLTEICSLFIKHGANKDEFNVPESAIITYNINGPEVIYFRDNPKWYQYLPKRITVSSKTIKSDLDKYNVQDIMSVYADETKGAGLGAGFYIATLIMSIYLSIQFRLSTLLTFIFGFVVFGILGLINTLSGKSHAVYIRLKNGQIEEVIKSKNFDRVNAIHGAIKLARLNK